MVNILTLNDTKVSSDFQTRQKAVKARCINKRSVKKTCSYYHCSRSSLWRWIKRWEKDKSDESLALKSHRPLTKHPKSLNEELVNKILNIHRRSSEKTPFEIWCELYALQKPEFSCCFMSVLRVFQRNNLYEKYKTNKKKKHNGIYETPKETGLKWQIDVKFVPKETKAPSLLPEEKFYQYTILDEYSRKRFLYFTNEHSMYETVKALKQAIDFFGYIPVEIQTDNGFEFSDKAVRKKYSNEDNETLSLLAKFVKKCGIIHHFIRPRTPQHNGKVERSHRIDQEKFYRNLSFYSLEDLRKQGEKWMDKYNNTPRFILKFKTPNQMELESFKNIYLNSGEIRCPRCFTSFVS